MVDPIAYLIVAVTALLLSAGTIFLSYWVPKRLGYKKFGIALASILTLGSIFFVLEQFILKDYLFFKSDARKFLLSNDIILNDNFEITSHDSDEMLDSYQKFILSISPSDKMRIIESIKFADNFDQHDSTIQPDNSLRTVNYEDDDSYIRKSTQRFGSHEISIINIIEVAKNTNTLTCYKYIP